MYAMYRIHVAVTQRCRALWRAGNSDRGDSPIPSAIIIAGLAIIAIGVLAWLTQYVSGFMDAAPTEADLPEPPAPGQN